MYIPNKEIQRVFEDYAAYGCQDRFTQFAGYSQEMLLSIQNRNQVRVGELVQLMHNEFVSSIQYNDENSLCCVVMIAMLASLRTYHKAIREFPCGKGFADLVYLPLSRNAMPVTPILYPALRNRKAVCRTQFINTFKKQDGLSDSVCKMGKTGNKGIYHGYIVFPESKAERICE